MKTNILNSVAIATILTLFAACSTEPVPQNYAPNMNGTIGLLTDVNAPSKTPLSGVIEDNPSYAAGEQFYWHDGDQVKMLFFLNGNLNADPIEIMYTANVPSGKPNSCGFTAGTGVLPAGNYTVYGLYPADGWSKDATGYKADFPNPLGLVYIIPFSEASSAHLKDYMFMKADVGDVTISAGGDNTINFSFKHLTSVVRFHVTSDYNATSIETHSALTLSEKGNNNFFYTAAYLNSIDAMDLTPVSGSECSSLSVFPMAALPFVKKGSTWEFDYYMPIFPTKESTAGKMLKIETFITVNSGDTYQQTFNTYNGLSFTNELSFMPNGFEVGNSYYFNLKTDI